jgi:acyl-ACP thioesterase
MKVYPIIKSSFRLAILEKTFETLCKSSCSFFCQMKTAFWGRRNFLVAIE